MLAMLKVREGALYWTQVMRSSDLFRGLPYNFVQFTMLYEAIAGWLGLKMAAYNLIIDSLHVYHDSWRTILASARGKLSRMRIRYACHARKRRQHSQSWPSSPSGLPTRPICAERSRVGSDEQALRRDIAICWPF